MHWSTRNLDVFNNTMNEIHVELLQQRSKL